MPSSPFSTLNEAQKRAVEITKGRVLILAGAGSGKTKVIACRIAYLIQEKVAAPEAILGLTFTNKAAREMRQRVEALIGKPLAAKVTLCTFHSFCLQILRKEISLLGFTPHFSLYDEADMKRLLTQLARNLLEHEGELPSIEPILALIREARSQGIPPSEVTWKEELAKDLYLHLERCMRSYNAVDFDGLLTLTLQLFEKHPHVLAKYQSQFSQVMIDEYQDTSAIQYKLASLLSAIHQNLYVVGDDDQSIYGWRGAEIKNILEFPATTLIKLQQNYRSLPAILHAANALISRNSSRHDKTLFSASSHHEPITLFHGPKPEEEAQAVIQRLLFLKKEKKLRWRDFAILYRSNHLSRPIELALLQGMWQEGGSWRRGIPYRIFGDTELMARTEVKDLLAYLRLIANPSDEEALLRIINTPRRGISDKTLDTLTQISRSQKLPLWTILNSRPLPLSEKAARAVYSFTALIENAKQQLVAKGLQKGCQELMETIQYRKAIEEEVKSEKARQYKWENVQSYIDCLASYEEQSKDPSLSEFLASNLLDEHRFSREDSEEDRVQLMTFHGAKGLEFEACFLVALEEQIIPHERSLLENRLEEERRLLYVAITRAKKYLTLSLSRQRTFYGKEEDCAPSRFLFEIPKELLRIVPWKHPI
jgi:DNA helicase-2/ATP-dependent DNA helicase PcrA